jgi:hypothetical protein
LAVPVDWTFGPLFSKIFDDDVKMTILLCYVVIPFLGWANSFHAASDEFLRPVGCKAHKFEAAHISAIHSQTRRKLSLGQTGGDAPDNPLSEQEWVEKHTSASGCVP